MPEELTKKISLLKAGTYRYELFVYSKERNCTVKLRLRGRSGAGVHEKTDILFMKACYENCQQDFGGIIMGKILDEDLIYEILSVVEEIPEGKSGLLRTDRTADRAG